MFNLYCGLICIVIYLPLDYIKSEKEDKSLHSDPLCCASAFPSYCMAE